MKKPRKTSEDKPKKAPAKKGKPFAPAKATSAQEPAGNDYIPVRNPKLDAPLAPISEETLMLLSAYIDGELAHQPERLAEAEHLLDTRADAREAFSKLKELQSTVAQVAELSIEELSAVVMPDCWSSISSQLDADEDFREETSHDTEPASTEFLTAYYDNELPRTSPGVQAFEAKLNQDVRSSKTLADWLALSKLLKGFIYRLEEACRLDLAEKVLAQAEAERAAQEQAQQFEARVMKAQMADFQEEAQAPHIQVPELSPDMAELVSAYFDNDGLSPKDKTKVSLLLEKRDDCRDFAIFNRQLRDGISRITSEIEHESTIPVSWEAIKRQLTEEAPKRKLFSMPSFSFPKKWVAAASIAASFLLVAIFGFNSLPFFQPSTPVAKQAAVQQQVATAQSSVQAPEDEASEKTTYRASRRRASGASQSNTIASASSDMAPAETNSNSQAPEGALFALPSGSAPGYMIRSQGETVEGGNVTYVSNPQNSGTQTQGSPSNALQPASPQASRPARPRVANRVPSSEAYLIEVMHEDRAPSQDVQVLYDL